MQEQTHSSSRVFFLALAAYFVLQIVLRTGLSYPLNLDEAEQAFEFQQLRLGYDTQPPLYAWLQWIMFSVFGLNLFALSALKNLLLFAAYVGMFQLARPMIGTTGAMAVSISLLLFPEIGWEAQFDRTHSVLLAALACATLWCYFALLRKPGIGRYACFGLLVGLGLQSKYNFALFLASLASASLLVPEHRQILWNRKVWIAVAVALLCMLPHGFWLLNNLDTATRETLDKMRIDNPDAGYMRSVAVGLGNMLLAPLAFITPLWIVYGLACRGYFKRTAIDWRNPGARFFIFLYLAFFAWMTALVLSGEVSSIKPRWTQAVLLSLPLAFFVVLPEFAQAAVFRRIVRASVVIAIAMMLAIPLRLYLGPAVGRYMRAHDPYPQLSAELARQFPQARILIAGDRLLAGNLYFERPILRVLLLSHVVEGREAPEGEVLLVVRSGTQADWLQRFLAAYPLSVVQQHGRLDLRYQYGSTKTMSYDYARVTARGRRSDDLRGELATDACSRIKC